MKIFVVIQPGCDMYADDVFAVTDEDSVARDYVLKRGVSEEFLRNAEIGDVAFFDKERVIMRVRRAHNGTDWVE